MQAFVSYQRADTLWAAHLLGYALRAAGCGSFIDTGSIGGGEAYRDVIQQAIERSNVVLALVGPTFDVQRLHNSDNVVAFEWRRARFHGAAVVPVLVDGAAMPADESMPPALRWFTRRNAYALRRASLGPDVDALVTALPLLATAPRAAARVLWVDDQPANNEAERDALRPHGLVFDNVVSTREALAQLENERYDLVITDLARTGSSDASRAAGQDFLAHPALRRAGPPVIVYAGLRMLAQADTLLQRGASAVTADAHELIHQALRLLGRGDEPAVELVR